MAGRGWIAAAVLATAVMALWGLRKDAEPKAPMTAASQQVAVMPPVSAPSMPATPAARADVPLPSGVMQGPPDPIPRTRANKARLDAIFQADRNDPAAPVLEAEIQRINDAAFVKEARYQPTAVQAECKYSMCRMEAEFDAFGSANEWVNRMLLELGGTRVSRTEVTTLPGATGKVAVTVYAYRTGRG